MSGSLTSIYNNVSYALNLHSKAITLLQEQASTGNRVNRASDSPSEAYRILGLNSQERSLSGYQETVAELIGNLEISSTIISDMSSELASVRTLMTQIVGGVYDSEGQKRIAEKINSTLEQVVSLANTKHAGQYLFGGCSTGTAPYEVVREDGDIVAVNYRGSDASRSIAVASGLSIETYHVGDEIFHSDHRQTPVFLGDTGAAAGTGTSTVQGDVWMTVDFDGSNYRISIDGGATYVTVPTAGDSNLAVTSSTTGEVLYVDTTGITAAGTELVRVPGTYDVFTTLINLRDLLLNGHGLETQKLLDYANECLKAVDEVYNLLLQAEVSTGSKIGFLETLSDNLEDMEYDTQDETTRLQEADIAQITIDLARREVLYEMSLQVAGTLMNMSLLDYI
ncbi:MAG TPA: flagellar hook-associated protein FlgL [Sedimentisphaerales bacterium]|jgi:flagellar hook-associated protein 3 FlgL|nr:flagellar hook-associated protein FlgL [Sedimentisphaerales bacterium]HNU27763.1 flagellar hook-associated protein FlgL [Sedimentisphaerales bacterium]